MQTNLLGMKLFEIVCILMILAGTCLAEDLIFFADDHYKSLGHLELKASVINPALSPGDRVLRINLANFGYLEELLPINDNGSEDDIKREMQEEMHSVDAMNINVALDGTESIRVTSGAQRIAILRAGDVSLLLFNITAEKSARGWIELPLRVEFMQQVDVSVSNGTVSPLYQSLNQSFNLRIFVAGDKEPLRIRSIRSELSRGESGTLSLVIENDGAETRENCSARLLAAPPFHVESPDILLGDLATGSMALASFSVAVDANARLQDYQLGCLIRSGERSMELAVPLTLTGSDNLLGRLAAPLFGGLIVLSLAAFLLLKKNELIFRRKGRPPRLQQFWQRDRGRSR
jgi:hypothetical protein